MLAFVVKENSFKMTDFFVPLYLFFKIKWFISLFILLLIKNLPIYL